MKRNFLIFGLFIILAIVGILFSALSPQKNINEPPTVKINDYVFQVEIADTPAKRVSGLSNRNFLPEGEGMLFLFNRPEILNFWMKDMKFPIDIVWVRGDRVIGLVENASVPIVGEELPIYSSPEPADKVLEINAGLVRELNIKIGDSIEI